jgi:hypothetical protein
MFLIEMLKFCNFPLAKVYQGKIDMESPSQKFAMAI